jgi:beta-barrel assembly-enhancing protease
LSEAGPAFIASAFHPQVGSEAVEGRVVLDRWRLRFEGPALILEMPLARLLLELDESSGGRVCFSDPEQPDCWICTFDARILRNLHLRESANTRSQLRSIESRGELQRRLKLTLGFVAGFALLACLVSMLTGLMVRALVAQVPLEWEQQLGYSLLQQEQQERVFFDDTNLMTRLTNAVAPLLAALPADGRHYDFYLADEGQPNAFALPGGHVVVTRGLMDLADRPEELAAVMAHEIAHVTQRHLFRKVVSSAGPLVVCRLFAGSRSGVLGVLGAGSQLLVVQSFSQEYELEADAVGWDYLVAARIDPRAAPEILRKLQAVELAIPFGDGPRAFSSHPATDKRIQRLEAKWKKLKNKADFTRQ